MEKRVSNIILGIAGSEDRFALKWGWFTFHLKIKPISTRQLIKISGEICQIRDFEDENITYFQALMEHAKDAEFISRAIAIATGTRFVRIVTRAISKLPNKDQNTLFKILIKNSDAEVFFWNMALAKKMNILKKKPEQ
jgi:hypothetical protein